MGVRLEPLSDRTIAITGASSGIELSTARHAAERGDPKHLVRYSRLYTNAQLRPLATAAIVAARVTSLAFLARARRAAPYPSYQDSLT